MQSVMAVAATVLIGKKIFTVEYQCAGEQATAELIVSDDKKNRRTMDFIARLGLVRAQEQPADIHKKKLANRRVI